MRCLNGSLANQKKRIGDMDIQSILDEVIRREGGYVNDARDAGGETNWGITIKTARANGYGGDMKKMQRHEAEAIYRKQYVIAPGFHLIAQIDESIAAEVVDTGVNMGPSTATRFLQRALNAMNNQARDYGELVVDGELGKGTLAALSAFVKKRGQAGVEVMLRALNALQGARYIELGEMRGANEAFMFGWFRTRVGMS
jgi:lysozyme family protein